MCRILPWNYSHLVLSKSFLVCQTLSDLNLILHNHIILSSICNYMSEIKKNYSITTLLSVPFWIMWLNLLWKISLCQLCYVDSEHWTILEVCSQYILVHICKPFKFSSTHRERNEINIAGLFWSLHWRLRSLSWHILELLQIFTLKYLPETVIFLFDLKVMLSEGPSSMWNIHLSDFFSLLKPNSDIFFFIKL
jgi:hypothetical protein